MGIDDKWFCKRCWHRNYAQDFTCAKCGGEKKLLQLKNWYCVKCGWRNPLCSTVCGACKSSFYDTLKVYENYDEKANKNQWVCSNCNSVNAWWAKRCWHCSKKNPRAMKWKEKLGLTFLYITIGAIFAALAFGLVNWCTPQERVRKPYHNATTGEEQYEYGGSREQKRDLERIDDYLEKHPDE